MITHFFANIVAEPEARFLFATIGSAELQLPGGAEASRPLLLLTIATPQTLDYGLFLQAPDVCNQRIDVSF